MSRELFLARGLIEAAVDPYAPSWEGEEAASKLAAFALRFEHGEERRRYPVRVDYFENAQASDLSPTAWLLFLENAEWDDPIVPNEILENVFQNVQDEVIRFRLISATLGHPKIRHAYDGALEKNPAPTNVADLPECWPRMHLLNLDSLGRHLESEDGTIGERLLEFVLYLLQDGSTPARALAAAAVAPTDQWRFTAHELARNIVRTRDPELTGYGAVFRQARI
jgi:hypothetical protein